MRRPSPARRALTWWFSPPYDPWVSATFAVDFSAARGWLDHVNAGRDRRVTVHHVVAAAVARTLRAFPQANGRVVGRRIVLDEHVGVVMPVNLVGHGPDQGELSLAMVERADTLSLVDLAERARERVAQERAGSRSHPLMDALWRLAVHAPDPVFHGALRAFDRAVRHPVSGPAIYRRIGVTTAISNVGSTFSQLPGMVFRAVSLAPPQRLFQVGTIWGISAVQDEAVVVDGRIEVRPMLPVMMLFDHRLVDGMIASRIAAHFGRLIADPAREFGETGRAPPRAAGA